MYGIKELTNALKGASVSCTLIDAVLDSGYYLRDWVNPFNGHTWQSVSDGMYGNKELSSNFKLEDFIAYIRGEFSFPALPAFRRYEAKSVEDIEQILAEPRRAHYVNEGSLSFRGQPREYSFRRRIPNPVRSDRNGFELSILPGLYRQSTDHYSFSVHVQEQRSFEWFLKMLEPTGADSFRFAYDNIRTEQHYATQTGGLDLTFELNTALFFATHQFKRDVDGRAFYDPMPEGAHTGIIYCFRFCAPAVKKSEYLIQDFDFFKTYPPIRILRQDCGLPLIAPEERNIAITDIDCIIHLAPDFSLPKGFKKTPEFMFPSAAEDPFYAQLLRLKDMHPESLQSVVEYRWARPGF